MANFVSSAKAVSLMGSQLTTPNPSTNLSDADRSTISAIVDAAPQLSTSQRSALSVLLVGGTR